WAVCAGSPRAPGDHGHTVRRDVRRASLRRDRRHVLLAHDAIPLPDLWNVPWWRRGWHRTAIYVRADRRYAHLALGPVVASQPADGALRQANSAEAERDGRAYRRCRTDATAPDRQVLCRLVARGADGK